MSNPCQASSSLVVGQSGRDLSDAELACRLLAGEKWAGRETWRRFAPFGQVTVERALGSSSDAEDLAQDVFVRVFRSVSTLREPACLRSFVYSVTMRTLKSHFRRRRHRAWLSFQNPETLLDLRHSVVDIEARDLLRSFSVLLHRLSARDRAVFLLRRGDAMTVEEIATVMGLSTSTVKRSLSHASERLARWINGDPGMTHLLDALGGRFR
jgi:RNA polymerase sigma-70 factor (ECF subfamily)